MSWGRLPPVQANAPVIRGERTCWNSNPSIARSPAASSVSRLPLSRTEPRAWPPSGTQLGRGIALLPGHGEQQRVEADQAVGHQRERHLAGVRRAPSRGVPAPAAARALPFGVGGIHPDDAVARSAPRAKTLSMVHSRTRLRVSASSQLAFGRAEGVDAAR